MQLLRCLIHPILQVDDVKRVFQLVRNGFSRLSGGSFPGSENMSRMWDRRKSFRTWERIRGNFSVRLIPLQTLSFMTTLTRVEL